MERGNVEENALQSAPAKRRPDQAEEGSCDQETQTDLEKLRADLFALRAHCHPNPDLTAALRDRVTEDAVRSDAREEKRDAGEDPRKQRGRAPRDEAVRDPRFHRADVVDRQDRVSRVDQFTERPGEGFGLLARAGDYEIKGVLSKSERQVNGALAMRLRERGLFHRAYHADDGE